MNGKQSHGFSLFEMLMVVAIIGVIAVSAVPVAELTYIKGKETELEKNLDQVRQAIKLFKRDCRNAVATQYGYRKLIDVPDSRLYPASLNALFNPAAVFPAGKYEVLDKNGAHAADFYPKPYLDKIPIDPFVGGAVWMVHYASGTSNTEYNYGDAAAPLNHVGIFDISCITDPTKRRGFIQAIDGTKYEDW